MRVPRAEQEQLQPLQLVVRQGGLGRADASMAPDGA